MIELKPIHLLIFFLAGFAWGSGAMYFILARPLIRKLKKEE